MKNSNASLLFSRILLSKTMHFHWRLVTIHCQDTSILRYCTTNNRNNDTNNHNATTILLEVLRTSCVRMLRLSMVPPPSRSTGSHTAFAYSSILIYAALLLLWNRYHFYAWSCSQWEIEFYNNRHERYFALIQQQSTTSLEEWWSETMPFFYYRAPIQ